jgi:flagellin-like protein
MHKKKNLNTKILKIIYIKKEVFILRNKKAISPLIATVLLIGFTIVLAALVFQWGGQLFKTTTQSTGCESQGRIACTSNIEITLGNVAISAVDNTTISKLIVNNGVSSSTITTLNIQLELDDGSIQTKAVSPIPSISAGSSYDAGGILFATGGIIKAVHVIPGFVQTGTDGSTCNMVCQEQTVTALPAAITFS